MKPYFSVLREIFIYGIIGMISAGTDAAFFHFFVYQVNIFSLFANILSTSIGILISYLLNLNFNFKIKDHIFKRFLAFSAIGIFGLLISTMILAFGEYQNLNIFITKLFSIVLVAIVQFVLNKFISFKKSTSSL